MEDSLNNYLMGIGVGLCGATVYATIVHPLGLPALAISFVAGLGLFLTIFFR